MHVLDIDCPNNFSPLYEQEVSILMFLFYREPLFDCLKDVDLIPPFNRMLLEVTFGKLYSWAIQNVRNILLEASARFKEHGNSPDSGTL